MSFDEGNADWMIANSYVLPPLWHSIATTTDLLVVFPTEYPVLPPVGFYLKADIPLSVNGHLYQAAYHEACSDPLTQGWKWYCVYINAGGWQPAPVIYPGDWRKESAPLLGNAVRSRSTVRRSGTDHASKPPPPDMNPAPAIPASEPI